MGQVLDSVQCLKCGGWATLSVDVFTGELAERCYDCARRAEKIRVGAPVDERPPEFDALQPRPNRPKRRRGA